MKFFRRSTSDPVEPAAPPPAEPTDAGATKGRPTPTRKDAEALRKQTLQVPSSPKAAKKAAKARAAKEKELQRRAIMAGDESALPPRDAGPVKKWVRDYVDSRYTASEFFMPLALAMLILGFLPWSRLGVSNAQGTISMIWLILLLFMVIDVWFLILRMTTQLAKRWPDRKDRKGTTFYAIMRILQLRRLRLPPPTVRRGGEPIEPKQKK